MLDLIHKLSHDKKFKNVRYISGITNMRMAKLAVRRLGFQYSNFAPESDRYNEVANYPHLQVGIHLLPEDLLAKKEDLERVNLSLKSR